MICLSKAEEDKFYDFISKASSYYPKEANEFIGMAIKDKNYWESGVMMQIFAYLFANKVLNDKNLYTIFLEYLLYKFPNLGKKKILEVASGYLPGLSLLINEVKRPENAIVCMDPKLINLDYPNIIVKQELFKEDYDTSNYDLLIAHCPCDGFDDMVENILKHPINMCVQTCPCREIPFYNYYEFKYYFDKQIDRLRALEDLGYEVSVDYTDARGYVNSPAVSVVKREHPRIRVPKKM